VARRDPLELRAAPEYAPPTMSGTVAHTISAIVSPCRIIAIAT
jgi:hypothetical protein